MKRAGRVIILVGWIMLGPAFLFAQTLSQHNWYFGNSKSGIRFNRITNAAMLVTDQATPFGTGGSAVATDPANGNLLFYTDGNAIYDVTHKVMPGGAGLLGSVISNQPVVVCPVPGSPNKYAIFANTANFATGTAGTVTFTIVDMAAFGNSVSPLPPYGDVVVGSKNISASLPANRAEGMIVIPDANGKDYWLVTSAVNATSVEALHVDSLFFKGSPALIKSSAAGGYAFTAGNFSYYSKTSKVAVSPQDASTDAFILNFNTTTGTFVLDREIFNSGVASTAPNSAIYDIEWDPKGQYLYISRPGQAGIPADLLQYDYVNSDPLAPTTVMTSVLTTPVAASYGIQLAPDSAIYYIYQATAGGPFLVDTFTKTDTIASQVVRNKTPLGSSNFAGTQFPNFLPPGNPGLKADFTFIGTCQNNPTTFYPTVSPNADSLKWDFGDGADTIAWSPVHKFAQPQTYSVKLTAYFVGDSVVVTHPVTINPFPLQITLVQDTTICRPAFPPPRGTSSPTQATVKVKVTGGTATSYNWSNGDTGPNLMPDSAGYYYVVVSDGSGCSTYAGVNVKEHLLRDQRENIWYFGNNAGIDFNKTPPVALNTSAMQAPEGCAIVCDRNGQVIFYTNGSDVYDKTNTKISPSGGIGGDIGSTQSSLIIPVPGDETLYYIFTTQEINGTSSLEARYSLFDLKANSGNGAVTQSNVLLFSRSTERVTGTQNWVIFHEYGNNTFRAYPISAGGIGDPVLTAIGSDHSIQFPGNGEGYMKLSSAGELAVALSDGSGNYIELFDFDDKTGKLTNFRRINLNEPAGQVYGIEFSPGGTKLYATLHGGASKFIEYYLDSLKMPHHLQTLPEPADMGAIQIAPNGEVFIAMNDTGHNGFLALVQPSEDTTVVSTVNLNGFALHGGTTSTYGLPNFKQQINNAYGGPDIQVTGLCLGDSTKFTGSSRDELDQFIWNFGDGAGLGLSQNANPTHVYAKPGNYTVTMTLVSKCGDSAPPFTKNITIHDKPKLPTINPPQSLCKGSITLDANSGNIPGLTYKWSTGDTTKLKLITNKIFISVVNTDQFGCQSKDSTVVGDARPYAQLGPDQIVCQNTPVANLNASNPPGTVFQWVLNGVNVGTAQTQPVSTAVANSAAVPAYIYSVTATFPNTCFAQDTVSIKVNVNPDFALSKTDPTSCGAANGAVNIQINTSSPPGGPLYSYFLTGTAGFNTQGFDISAPTTIPITGLSAGQPPYTVLVSDQVTGCVTQQTIGLSDATFTANGSATPTCNPVPVSIVTSATQFPLKYLTTETSTGKVTSGTSSTANFGVSLNGGTYNILVTDNLGCTKSIDNFVVTSSPPAVITITPNLCASPQTLVASGSSNYTWDPSASISGATNAATITLTPTGTGTQTFTVHSSPTAPACGGTQSIVVDVTKITPDFTQSNACSIPVYLNATPIGNYVYSWFLNGTQLTTGGETIVAPSAGNYSVTIFNPGANCSSNSTVKPVTMNDALIPPTITVNPSPPCDDGKPFVLTATTLSTGVTYTWSVDGAAIPGATTASITETNPGNYTVSITKVITCPAVVSAFPINRVALPVGALPEHAVICNDPENSDTTTTHVRLYPGAFSTYNWFKNELSLGVVDPVLVADSEGIYKVDFTNSSGCLGTDQTIVENLCEPKIVAPNAFRPGSNQSANKEFYVFSFFITDNFQVFIYNRWGELVYQSNDRYFKWNGNFNNSGNALAGGTYAYVIKYYSSFEPEKGVQEKHGGVVLLR